MVALSRTGRLLRRLVRLSCRRPIVTVGIALLLAAISVVYTVHALTFRTSTRALLPQNAGFVQRYGEYAKEFGELEDIVVVVEAGSFEGARAYATRLTDELELGPGQVPPHRLPHRPQALRGPPAPLPPRPGAARDPRQDLRPPGVHGELRGRSEPGPAARGREHPDGGRLRVEPVRHRAPGQGPAGGHPLPAGAAGPDGEPARAPGALSLAVGHAVLLRRGSARGRGLLPLRRQEPALHPGRDSPGREGQLHRRPGSDRDHPRHHRAPAPRVPERAGGRHRRPRPLQRRDDLRLPRQQHLRRAGLRPDPGGDDARVHAGGQAGADAGGPRGHPRVVDGPGHSGGRPPDPVLGDVHLDRGGHRHRLRHLLPLPLRGGDLPRPEPARGPRADRGPHRARHADRGPHRGRAPSSSSSSPTSVASRSWASSRRWRSCWRGSG